MSEKGNEGVYMPGAKIRAQNFAIGTGAYASVVMGAETRLRDQGRDELAALLRGLQEAVDRDRDRLEAPEDVEEAVAQVASQLTTAERPNKLTLRGILRAIAQAAATSTAVAAAAQALADAIQHLA